MTRNPVTRRAVLVAVATAPFTVLTSACGTTLPRDAQGSLDRATGGILEVGASESSPWILVDDQEAPTGIEADLVVGFAATIGAAVSWTTGPVDDLARAVESDRLDLVVAGLTADTPWSDVIAITRPYRRTTAEDGTPLEHVLGVRPGENALQLAVERYLATQAGQL